MEQYIKKSDLVAEIERLKNTSLEYGYNTMQKVLADSGKDISLVQLQNFIDTLEVKEIQEEPVSIWHDSSKETPIQHSNILMIRKEEGSDFPPIAGCFHGTNSRLDGRNWGYYNGFCYNEIEPPLKWAYVDDLLILSNVERTVKDWKEPVSEELEQAAVEAFKQIVDSDKNNFLEIFKAGAEWQKEKEYTCYEEAFEDGAKWKVENLWKPADGDDLPEIDREVIALLNSGKVVFAHRPPEYWDGKDIVTGNVTRNYPKTYDKGGWNIPNVKWWLDCSLPKEIEL